MEQPRIRSVKRCPTPPQTAPDASRTPTRRRYASTGRTNQNIDYLNKLAQLKEQEATAIRQEISAREAEGRTDPAILACALVLRRLVDPERHKKILLKVDAVLSEFSLRHVETGQHFLLTDIIAPEFSLDRVRQAGRIAFSAPHRTREQAKLDTDMKLLQSLQAEFSCERVDKFGGERPVRSMIDSLFPPEASGKHLDNIRTRSVPKTAPTDFTQVMADAQKTVQTARQAVLARMAKLEERDKDKAIHEGAAMQHLIKQKRYKSERNDAIELNKQLSQQLQDVTERYAKLLQGKNPFPSQSIEKVDDLNILETISQT